MSTNNFSKNKLTDDDLSVINGGATTYHLDTPYEIGDKRCPQPGCCGALACVKHDNGCDKYRCKSCNKEYIHIWEGDAWWSIQ